jgi:hypothetical protein
VSTFTADELRQLQISDQVEDQLTPAERNRLHSAESVRRRIERIGLEAYQAIRRQHVRNYYARIKARRTTRTDP